MSVRKIAVSGVKWTTLSSVVSSIVKLIQVAILTRYLTKADFGIIAIAILFISFTRIFLDMGLSTAIMHKQQITKNEYSSLFWLNVITGVILSVILILCAPLVAAYYQEDILTPVIQLLSLNIFFSSIGRQSKTIRHKQMNFKFMSIVDNSSAILTLLLVIVLAMNGFGVYALVYSTMFEIILSNIIYLIHGISVDKNISSHFRFSETKPYLNIGVYQLGSSILDYFAREIDVFLISTAFGKETLGAYSLCKRIVQMLYAIVTPILLKVATPILATLQDSKENMSRAFIKMLHIVSLINFPIFTLVALLSPLILKIVYGDSYIEYSFILTILAGIYAITAAVGSVSSVQIALGRTDIGLYWTIYRIIANAIVLYIGSLFSPTVMVVLLLISTVINLLPFWKIQVKAMLSISFFDFLRPMLFPCIMSSILLVLCYRFVDSEHLIKAIVITFIFVLVYLIGVYKFKEEYIPKAFRINNLLKK